MNKTLPGKLTCLKNAYYSFFSMEKILIVQFPRIKKFVRAQHDRHFFHPAFIHFHIVNYNKNHCGFCDSQTT